jgi:hypothetical protein
MKKNKEQFKITEHQMSGYLGDSQYNRAILWLLTIPKEELSDSMLSAYNTMKKEGDEVITTVQMPEVPGADAVLEAAEKFYEFVSGTKK